MSSKNKKYWSAIGDLTGNDAINKVLRKKEFSEEIPTDEFLGDKETLDKTKTSRRDFLKYVGFSTAAASLAACEGPVTKTVPYVVQPHRIKAGVANFYATTIADGFDFSRILVKTREARPIRVDKNYMSGPKTSTNARAHASVLTLYDYQRLQQPKANQKETTWETLDQDVPEELKNVSGEVVLLTQTFASPTTAKLIKEFKQKYNARHIIYDAVSEDHVLNAFEKKYGQRAMPDYDLSKSEVIVSVGADFLGDWQGGGYDAAYAKSRIPKDGKMSRHVQFEANMTITGVKADKRVLAKPSEQKKVLAGLYRILVEGGSAGVSGKLGKDIEKAAKQLRKAGSGAVVLSGIPDTNAQLLVLGINEALNSKVMDTDNPRLTRQGNAKAVQQLIKDMNAGKIGALLIAGVNPSYSLPNADEFTKGLEKVDCTVAFARKEHETAKNCKYIATTPHFLESWGDVRFTKTHYSLMQPTIRTLFNTRQFQDTLLAWMGKKDMKFYDYLRKNWEDNILKGGKWNEVLRNGIFESESPASVAADMTADDATEGGDEVAGDQSSMESTVRRSVNLSAAASSLVASAKSGKDFELHLYTSIPMGDGRQANNPWLQELPDPIARTTWDNFVSMSMRDAKKLGVKNYHVSNGALNGSCVNLTLGKVKLENVPVIIQPGQAPGSLGLALGYGRKEAIQKEMQTGINAYPLYQDFSTFQAVKVEKADGKDHEFACTQLQNTMVGRTIVNETSLETYNNESREVWNPIPTTAYDHEEVSVRGQKADLWTPFDTSIGPHFNMSIDLNACTGCGACVIACHAENNVPVVGKTEVRKFRDMHWMRIDRYYASADTFEEEVEELHNLDPFETYDAVETPSYDNPEAAFQPVMCQHCEHAPCETVCPVNAITHGRQGQNQMVYNRCVGTRYCANNCPYKVRRFNWFLYKNNDEFDYNMNNDLGRMVLNPDVVVRSRGVMEKCSLCIQLTQKTILDAKRDGRAIEDGEFYTACSRACDKGAITFGDINIEGAEINEKREDDRMYRLLESLGTRPNVMYQTLVRNEKDA